MKVLVTGGGGFLGGALARRMKSDGHDVRTFQRGDYPALEAQGIRPFRGDLADPEALKPALDGCEIVFHVAAKVGIWGDRRDFHRSNVDGTRHVIEQCKAYGVRKLVLTSSPSVVFDRHDVEGGDESLPYPSRYLNPYAETKAIAEKMVLAASSNALATVALRPHLVWGPGDPHLVPRILERARQGQLRLVGDGQNRVDSTYIDNAVDAHVRAAHALEPGAACDGKPYFITNGEPLALSKIVEKILVAGGLPPKVRSISPRAAYAAGAVMEAAYTILRVKKEPRITRFVALELATAHWFDIGAARRDFGYVPEISVDEGMRRLAAWLHE